MRRIASGLAAVVFVAALVAGCSSGGNTTTAGGSGGTQAPATTAKSETKTTKDEPTETTARRTATTQRNTGTTRGESTPTTDGSGSGSSENNPDAAKGLVTTSELPPGNWKTQSTSGTSNSPTSADEFKKYPACAAIVDDPKVFDQQPEKARASFNQQSTTELLQIEQTVQIFDNTSAPKDFVKILGAGDKLGPCMQDLIKNQPASSGAKITGDVTASSYDPGVTASELNVDEITGTTIMVTIEAGGQSLPTEITFINMRKGKSVSAFSVTSAALGSAAAVPPMQDTLTAAAKKLQDIG